MRMLWLALVLAGCATVPLHATDESMAARSRCLEAGGIWLETQERYACRPIPRGEPI